MAITVVEIILDCKSPANLRNKMLVVSSKHPRHPKWLERPVWAAESCNLSWAARWVNHFYTSGHWIDSRESMRNKWFEEVCLWLHTSHKHVLCRNHPPKACNTFPWINILKPEFFSGRLHEFVTLGRYQIQSINGRLPPGWRVKCWDRANINFW